MNKEFEYSIKTMEWKTEETLHFVISKFCTTGENTMESGVPWRQLNLYVDRKTGELTFLSRMGNKPDEKIELYKIKKCIDVFIRNLLNNTEIAKDVVDWSAEKGNFYEE